MGRFSYQLPRILHWYGLTFLFRRGKSGGQVRDEYRDEYDPGRGGYGRAIADERLKEEEEYGKGR